MSEVVDTTQTTATHAVAKPDIASTHAMLPPKPPAAALIDVKFVAVNVLSCSPRHIYRLVDAGKMPPPVRLGALVRWNRATIDAWIAAGCPSMKGGK